MTYKEKAKKVKLIVDVSDNVTCHFVGSEEIFELANIKPALISSLLERLIKLEDALNGVRYSFLTISDADITDGDICVKEANKALSKLKKDLSE